IRTAVFVIFAPLTGMAKNFISNKDECVRMFKNDVLESLSRVHFTVPLIIFLPVIFYFGYQSVFVFHLEAVSILLLIAAGLFIWTLTEYVLHRFVFHWELPGKIGKRIHFVFH